MSKSYENRRESTYDVGDVIQFTEQHKWRGCLGIITEIKKCSTDFRLMIAVPIPQSGTAYIYAMENEHEFEYAGHAVLLPADDD